MQARPSRSYRIACAVPGRVRIQVTDPRLRDLAMDDFARRLGSVRGVHAARAVPEARSVVLRCATEHGRMDELLKAIEQAIGSEIAANLPDRDERDLAVPGPVRSVVDRLSVSDGRDKKLHPLLLPTAALAAAAIEGLPAVATGALLAAAALPVARRAARALDRKRVTLAEMDLATLMILALTGRLVAAAELAWLLGLSDLAASRNVRRARRGLADSLPPEVGRDPSTREALALMLEDAPAATTPRERTLEGIARRASTPLAGLALMTYLLTRNPLRAIAVMKLGDIGSASDVASSVGSLSSLARAARDGIVMGGGGIVERLSAADGFVIDTTRLGASPAELKSVADGLSARGIQRIVMLTRSGRRVPMGVRTAGNGVAVAPASSWRSVLREITDDGRTAAFVWNGGEPNPPSDPRYVRIALTNSMSLGDDQTDIVALDARLACITRCLDHSRDAMALSQQNVDMTTLPNAAAFAGGALGLLSSAGSCAISTAAGIIAGANALKPLMGIDRAPRHAEPGSRTRALSATA